jgi:hypothetical protein
MGSMPNPPTRRTPAWYNDAYERWHDAHPLGGIFFRRHRVHVLKLAAVYAASETRTLHVTHAAWQRAVGKAMELEYTMFGLFASDMSKTGYLFKKMETAVLDAGPKGLLKSEFTSMFRNDRDLERHKQMLFESERMFEWTP